LLCHGNEKSIGGYSGKELAKALIGIIPKINEFGFIHIQSCSTGKQAAQEFTQKLGLEGYKVIVKAPESSTTFTEELGFRVLDTYSYTNAIKDKYETLLNNNAQRGIKALSDAIKEGKDLKFTCKNTYKATKNFWREFCYLFKDCGLPTGSGWIGYETTQNGYSPIDLSSKNHS